MLHGAVELTLISGHSGLTVDTSAEKSPHRSSLMDSLQLIEKSRN